MAYNPQYASVEPTREEIDRMPGPVVLEFGAAWCPHCQQLAPELEEQMKQHADLPHIKVEDGRGKPLGRSFRVKLWPTVVFLRDGQVVQQYARPSEGEIREGLASIAS